MHITNIHDSWGSIIEFTDPSEFFTIDKEFWRKFAYDRKLIIFKKMNFGLENYAKFSYYWGAPWAKGDYIYSYEIPIDVPGKNRVYSMTTFSSRSTPKKGPRSILSIEMPWHADIPNRPHKPFPWRSIMMKSNPNSENSGKTQWLNIEDSIPELSNELQELIPRIKIKQQSWYDGGITGVAIHDFIKIHPVTGKKSLRLNYYVGYPGIKNSNGAWIKNVYIDGIEQGDNRLIQKYIDAVIALPNTLYRHTWDEYDIALYDNYSFIHGRTALNFSSETDVDVERLMYRINIDHLLPEEWASHSLE